LAALSSESLIAFVLYAMSEYELYHIKEGTAENAMAFKEEPAFLDQSLPVIRLITVRVGLGEESGTDLWMQRTKDSIDWATLAGLLD